MMQVLNRQLDAFFHLDREENSLLRIGIEKGDLDDYIKVLSKNIQKNKKNRHFKFSSNDAEVARLLYDIINHPKPDEIFLINAEKIARRLLITEITTQDRHGGFSELQKGSLIISMFSNDTDEYFLISKVEHESFLDSSEFKKLSGLPYEKGTLKTCLVQINKEDKIVVDIIVTDSNTRISKYWSQSFLELEEINSDELNTLISFNAMDQFLGKNVKSKSLNDYTMIRNHLVTYYRSQVDFNFDNMIQIVFGEYTPVNTYLDIEELKNQVNELPEKKGFDRVFSIKEGEIKARIRKVYKLNSIAELRIIGSSDDLKNIIKSKTINGEKYLQIKIDHEETFKSFNFENDSNG